MISGVLVWALAVAQAHPFGARFAAHAVAVDVGERTIHVEYIADVPNPLVVSATQDPQADPVRAMALELLSGLVLEVDGETAELVPDGSWQVQRTDDTHQFLWRLDATVPHAPTTVELSNGNLPDVTAVFRAKVTTATDDLVLTESSLWRMQDGEIVLDETDRWRTDERMRVLRVTVRARPRLWPWLLPVGGLALTGMVVLLRRRAPPR